MPVEGGEPRPLTATRAPASDRDPAVSPDGRTLAYLSCGNCCWGSCDVMVMELDADRAAAGPPRRLTSLGHQMEGLTWTRDGRSLVVGTFAAGFFHLWRVGVDGRRPPERIEVAGFNARKPATGRQLDRLVFSRGTDEADIYRLNAGATTRVLAASSAQDIWPALSPDGRQIAFCSTRSGATVEVWLASSEGAGARPLSSGCVAAWSPAGQVIAFLRPDGQIWTIDVEGGNLRRVTTDAVVRHMLSWSSDGRWIYFGKGWPGDANIWRIPAAGGPEEQVTRHGGYAGFETADGRSLVYQTGHDRSGSPILIGPLAGGSSEELVASCFNDRGSRRQTSVSG